MSLELVPGAVVAGRYQLERPLGQGGMGVVWAVTHTVTRKRLALKFLKGPAHLRPELRKRFLREARAASAVSHPNLLEVNDVFDLEDGTPVMVMALLEGETLGRRLLRKGRLSLADTADILAQVVSGVGTAHAAGVIHRDLKPDNVFLVGSPEAAPSVRVLDFGIAKLTDHDPAEEAGAITGTGAMLGTPCYMSPEQAFGQKDIDHRADVWSLGVMFYECLSGARPVEGDSVGQVVKRLLSDGITPIGVVVPGLPADIVELIDRLLRREREERPRDLREVSLVLGRYARVHPPEFGPASSVELRDSVPDEAAVASDNALESGETLPSGPPGSETASTHAVSAPSVVRRRPVALWSLLGLSAVAATIVVAMRASRGESHTPSAASGDMQPHSAPPTIVAPKTVAPPALEKNAITTAAVPPPEAPSTMTPGNAPPTAKLEQAETNGKHSGTTKPVAGHVPKALTSAVASTTPPSVVAPASSAPAPAATRVGGLAEKPPF